jgi:hypothetical protein
MTIQKALLAVLIILAPSAQAEVISWPQQLEADDGSVVLIYQPQIEYFAGNSIEGRAAVSVKRPSTGNVPVFGAIWLEARIDTDRDTRTAIIRDIDVGEVRFADTSDEEKEALAEFIEEKIEGSSLTISVDQLLADLDAEAAGSTGANLRHEPPKIILSTEPAMLISIDGEPVFQEIEGSKYERVVNSAFLIVKDGRDHYLYIGSNTWYEASQITGPWSAAGRVPTDIAGLVEQADDDDGDFGDIRLIVVTEPTELLVSDGKPSWAPVEGMDLLYMDNTDSNAFLELSTQQYYVLLSGRWYRGEGMLGELQWTHVPNDELPEPFGDVPEDSVNGAILSQVAGTPQAREAVLDNTIPQTAAIDRNDTSFSVEYDGAPDFAPIEEISVEYAQNTAAAVFRYGNLYYACDDGVWYVSSAATGPWHVATSVPDAIYKIPASNAHHNVTYVKVYDVTPQVVYVGYTPSYYGSYYYHGAVVYGTGWHYHPWYGPYYYPRYPTWGFHVTYNPWYGWGVGVSWTNGPFRFTFSRHGAWWGVGGYRPYPRPVVYGGYRKTNINIDNSINIGGGRNRPETRPNIYNRPENRARNVERPATPSNRQARSAGGAQNNVLTDRSGNVYQRSANGSWSQRENGHWNQPQNLDRASSPTPAARPSQPSVSRPSSGGLSNPQMRQAGSYGGSRSGHQAVRPQLERDFSARQHGAHRTQNYQRQGAGRRR